MPALFSIKYGVSSIKYLLSLLVATLLFILVPTTFAQESTFSATPSAIPLNTAYQIPATISHTSPVYTDVLVHNMFHTFSCLMAGTSIISQPCLTYQATKNAQGAIQSVPVLSQTNLSGGALGATTSIIGVLYTNPPIKTADYLASLGKDFGIVKEAHAQVGGSGNAVLSPILDLWRVSRNMAYLMMIVVFVVIGLMVMFRQRINPQTVITAQAALPGLIIGLILITFSYFLAALLADLSFVAANLVGIFFSTALGSPGQGLIPDITTNSVLSIFSQFVGAIEQGEITRALQIVFNGVGQDVQNLLRAFAGVLAFQWGAQVGQAVPIIGPLAALAMGLFTGGVTAAFPPEVLGWVLWFASIAILIYSMFKLLLKLINTYLNIIFLTVTAPFHFLAASLPGRQGIATAWILNMLCHILAFPAVLAVFYFVAFILRGTTTVNSTVAAFPLLGGLDTSFINILLAFGALVATPAIPDIICRTIGRVTQAGQLIGQEVTGGVGAGRGYLGQATGGFGRVGGTIGGAGEAWRDKTSYIITHGGQIETRIEQGLGRRIFGGNPPKPRPLK